MPRSRPRYPAEYRQQMVNLVRSGRSPDHLAREFEPSAQSIRNWVAQADRDEGRRSQFLDASETSLSHLAKIIWHRQQMHTRTSIEPTHEVDNRMI